MLVAGTMGGRRMADRQQRIGGAIKWAFSRKQRFLICWWELAGWSAHDGIIAYGSVRSGKTVGMTIGFVLWAMHRFSGQQFGICGKTIGSVRRNVVTPLKTYASSIQLQITERKAENKLIISGYDAVNEFYLFGGNDESSQNLIQGITLAGVYFDEVALQNQAFVQQALARCSVYGSKYWFNCNPESPAHWFKTEFIDKAKARNLIVMHFVMDDNEALSPDIRERYKRSFVGVFYQRYILGEWAMAEGLIYFGFSDERNMTAMTRKDLFLPDGKFNSARFSWVSISIDYGTANPTAMLLIAYDLQARNFFIADEFYHDGHGGVQIDDAQKYAALEQLANGIPVQFLIIDPSALSLITMIRHRARFNVTPAENDVVPGISFTQTLVHSGRYKISRTGCPFLQKEIKGYVWDADAQEKGIDQPLKQADHAMDALRYHAYTLVHRYAGAFGVDAKADTDKYRRTTEAR